MPNRPLSGFKRAARALEFDEVRRRVAVHCRTGRGAELCLSMEPAPEKESAERLLDETGEMLPLARSGWLLFPTAVPDPTRAAGRARKGTLHETDDIKELSGFLEAAGRITVFLSDNPGLPAIAALCAGFVPLDEVASFFDATFAGDGSVKPSATALLMELEERIASLRRRIHARAEEILVRRGPEGLFQDSYVTVRNERLVLPVKAEFKTTFPGIIHGISASDKTVFMEPQELVRDNNTLQEAAAERDAEIYRILREAAALVTDNAEAIAADLAVMGAMDALFARAAFSASIAGVRPRFSGDAVGLYGLRHPVMAADEENPRPNDIELKEHERAMVVSGPNAGGKTVILKSVGLAAAMSACGIFPAVAEGSAFPFVSRVFAIAGDEQSIAEGESTFSAQVRGIREALEGAGPGTWVIIDEILNGTDPSQAGALAEALMDAFAARGSRMFISTHLTSLKIVAQDKPYMVNAAMGFGEDGRPTFRLEKGHPGVSRPLDVAAAGGIPDGIIAAARARLSSSQDQYQTALLDLQNKSEVLQNRIADAEAAKRAFEADAARLAKELEEAREAKNAFEREKRRKMKDEVARARTEISAMLEEARQSGEKVKKAAAGKLKEMENELVASIKRPETVPLEDLKEGDAVWVVALDKEARIEEFLDGDRVTVSCKGLRMTLGRGEILGMKEKAAKPSAPRRSAYVAPEEEHPEISLMGMTFDEAAPALDKFLDSSLLAGTSRVKIVHGRGVLRTKIAAHLKRSPYVKSLGPGAAPEGGDAVTIAELKD